MLVDTDEHPRATSLRGAGQARPIDPGGTVTAGNASGINDGAAAVLIASESGGAAVRADPAGPGHLGARSAGVPPRIMGIGPVPATRKLLPATG